MRDLETRIATREQTVAGMDNAGAVADELVALNAMANLIRQQLDTYNENRNAMPGTNPAYTNRNALPVTHANRNTMPGTQPAHTNRNALPGTHTNRNAMPDTNRAQTQTTMHYQMHTNRNAMPGTNSALANRNALPCTVIELK